MRFNLISSVKTKYLSILNNNYFCRNRLHHQSQNLCGDWGLGMVQCDLVLKAVDLNFSGQFRDSSIHYELPPRFVSWKEGCIWLAIRLISCLPKINFSSSPLCPTIKLTNLIWLKYCLKVCITPNKQTIQSLNLMTLIAAHQCFVVNTIDNRNYPPFPIRKSLTSFI